MGLLTSEQPAPDGSLPARIEEQLATTQPRPLTLGLDDIAALRSVLCGAELGDFHGLIALQAAVC